MVRIRNKKFILNKNTVVCLIEVDFSPNRVFNLSKATIQKVCRKRQKMNGRHPAIQILSFKGVAKCNASDTFSENTGKNIAETRALIKVYSYYKKFFRECCNETEKVLGQFEECQALFTNKINELDIDLTDLLIEE